MNQPKNYAIHITNDLLERVQEYRPTVLVLKLATETKSNWTRFGDKIPTTDFDHQAAIDTFAEQMLVNPTQKEMFQYRGTHYFENLIIYDFHITGLVMGDLAHNNKYCNMHFMDQDYFDWQCETRPLKCKKRLKPFIWDTCRCKKLDKML